MNPTTLTALPQFETLRAIWSVQPRAVRIFTYGLEPLWDNTPDRLERYPLFHDAEGRPVPVPLEGMGRNAWPVARVAAEGAPSSRNYWVSGGGEGSRCYRLRAWPVDPGGDAGRLIVEELERVDQTLCHDERLRQLDGQLTEMMNRVADLMMSQEEIDPLKLRLANANLQPCRQIKQCDKNTCPAWENENPRCWEIPATLCPTDEPLDVIGKFHYCNRCEAYLMACPDPLTRVGENFNRLMSFLQLKFEESLEVQGRVQHSERLAAVGELALGIAHEIKNPLSIIISRLDCLGMEEESLSGAELAEDLAVIRTHTARMRQTLDGLLAFAKPAEPRRVPVRVNEMVLETLPLVHKTLEKSRVQLKSRLSPRLPEILGDPVEIQQVLLNLLLNARDALEETSNVKSQTSRARWQGIVMIATRINPENPGEMLIEVRDNGCGMSAAEQKRIFSPFFTTKAGRGGSGLGLAVCTRIMGRHGGRIAVKSRPGRGSTFTLGFKIPD